MQTAVSCNRRKWQCSGATLSNHGKSASGAGVGPAQRFTSRQVSLQAIMEDWQATCKHTEDYRRGCKLGAQNAALAKKFKCAGEKPEIPHFFWLTLLRFSPATNGTVASNALSCWPGPVSRASELLAPRPTSFDMPLVRPRLPPRVWWSNQKHIKHQSFMYQRLSPWKTHCPGSRTCHWQTVLSTWSRHSCLLVVAEHHGQSWQFRDWQEDLQGPWYTFLNLHVNLICRWLHLWLGKSNFKVQRRKAKLRLRLWRRMAMKACNPDASSLRPPLKTTGAFSYLSKESHANLKSIANTHSCTKTITCQQCGQSTTVSSLWLNQEMQPESHTVDQSKLEHWCDPAYSGFSWHGKPTTAHTLGRFLFPNLIASKQGNQHSWKINEIWAIRFQDAHRGLAHRRECRRSASPLLIIQIVDLRSDMTTQNQTKFHMTHMTQLHMTQFQSRLFQAQAKTPGEPCVWPTLLKSKADMSACFCSPSRNYLP